MKRMLLNLLMLSLILGVANGVAEERIERTFTLGAGTHNLGSCGNGNCIAAFVEAPPGHHITYVHWKPGSSNFVHPCGVGEPNRSPNCGEAAFRWIPGTEHHKAEWLGWTDSGDASQAYTLIIRYEPGQ
jgi:hypothetical protein